MSLLLEDNGQKLPCHGNWSENQTTINGSGLKPVSQCKGAQAVPHIENSNLHVWQCSIIYNANFSNIYSFIPCDTNKSICFD